MERVNVGSSRYDYPHNRDKEHIIFKDGNGMRCGTIEYHDNGFYLLRIYSWHRDARFTAELGAWYITTIHLTPEELSLFSDGLNDYRRDR